MTEPMVVTGDEGTDHAEFEQYVGGINVAYRILRIYVASYPSQACGFGGKSLTKSDVFRNKMKQEGYPPEYADAFLAIQ